MNKKTSGLLLCTLIFGNILSAVKIKPKQKRRSYFSRIQKQAAIGSMALVTIIGVIIGGYNLWPKKSVVAPLVPAPVAPAPVRVAPDPDPVTPDPVAPAPVAAAPVRVDPDPVTPDPVAPAPLRPVVTPDPVAPVAPDPVAPVAPDPVAPLVPDPVAPAAARREPVAPARRAPAAVLPAPVHTPPVVAPAPAPAPVGAVAAMCVVCGARPVYLGSRTCSNACQRNLSRAPAPAPVAALAPRPPARREPAAAPVAPLVPDPVAPAPAPAPVAALCLYCNLKPKRSGHDFCSRDCGISATNKANMCNYCMLSQKLDGHSFCSRTCAHSSTFQRTPVSTIIDNPLVGIDGGGQRVTLYPFWHTKDAWDKMDHSADRLYPKTSDPADLGQCFSNWYVRRFSMNVSGKNIMFPTAEHALMFHKILYATGNIDIAKQVLVCGTPKDAKSFAAKYDPPRGCPASVGIKNWRNNKDKVAQDVLTAKFTQHQDLMALLKSTGNGILVEASPIDSGWGVGLASTNPAILNQSTWRGSNLLGKALMHVRDQSA